VADSDSFRQALAGWRAPVHIDTCYNCVELGAPDVAATATWRQRLLPADGVLIGSVGRLDDQKGYEHLVRAARRVVDAHPRVRFAIAGDGPRRAFLADLVAAQGLADRFFLCGFQADVTNFIAALDLFVSSSRWEGLPLALVEAMRLGKRVVATDVGGNREVVEPGRTGLLVAPGDPQALAAGLLEALDPGTPPLDGDAIRRTGRAFADPVANAEAFDAVLDQVVRSYGSGRLARTRLWRPIQRQGTEWPQRASSPEIQALSRPSPGAEGP
jgi:glycosyltransferase involved in cell wall biosynthesis